MSSGKGHSHPRGLRTSIASWSQLSWRDRPQGDIKVDQLRDNRSRHQFGECVMTIELESSREEKERAPMHDSQNRDTDMSAGYAFPRGQGPLHSGVSASQRGMRRRIIGET